jgi:hypothetical protein
MHTVHIFIFSHLKKRTKTETDHHNIVVNINNYENKSMNIRHCISLFKMQHNLANENYINLDLRS